MDIEEIDFLSRSKISEFRVLVNSFVIMDKAVSSSGRRLTPIEKAELLESLGTMEFYEGNWHQAVQCFKPSLTEYEETHSRRNPEQLIASFILFGIALFRLGELQNAFDTLEKAAKLAKEKKFSALAAKALSNCALICSRLNRLIDAISLCRQAIESSAEVNHVGSFDHLQYARILIQCYIKIRDYEKAENVVESFLFSKDEKILLLGGIYFAAGSLVKAGEILFKLIGSQIQPPTTGKRQSSISSDDLEKAIEHIENDLEQWSVAESKTEQDSVDDESDIEDPEIVQKRQEEENENIVKIERIVERAITLYNSSLFMPAPPPVDKAQRLQNAKSGVKEEVPTALTVAALQQNFHQSQRLQQLAMDSLKLFVRKLRKRRSQAYDDRKYDAFERVPWNFHPEVLSHDLYMYPAVCWAVLLQVNAERYLQDTVQFHQGLRIQRGDIVLSTEDYQEQFEATEAFFSKAIQVVEAARFHGGFETVDDDSPTRRVKSLAPKNSVFGDEESIKAAAANLAAAFGVVGTPASTTSKGSAAVSTNEVGSVKSRHTSTFTRPNKRGSTQSTISSTRRATKASEVAMEMKEDPVVIETTSAESDPTDAETIIAKMTGMDLQLVDTVDTSLLKDALLNVKQLINMDSDMRTNRMVVSTANKSLVRQGVTEFNPWTGHLGNNTLPSIFPTTNTGAKEDRPSNVVGQIRDPASSDKKEAVQISYKPKRDDPLSIRSEMIPTRATFGMDEEISWLQWALGAVGGISLGFLGHSCMSAEELIACVTADSEPRKTRNDSLNEPAQQAGPRLPESFLVEVRNRLLEVDTKLTLSDEIDVAGEEDITMSDAGEAIATTETAAGENINTDSAVAASPKKKRRGDYLLSLPSGQLETRLILLFVLVKVTAELHWKKELLPSLLQLEKTYEILRQRYGASIAYRYELLIYGAMVHKFRLEYDQWLMLSSEVMTDGERAEVLMLNILPRAKKYYQSAVDMMSVMQALNNNPSDPMGRDCGQLYLLKDAVKKLTNTYIAIGNIPIKITAMQGSYGGKKKPADVPASSAAPPSVQPPGTMEELDRFSEKDVEDREKNDIKWLQKFGRVRAQVIYRKYKEQFGNNVPIMQGGTNAATVVVSL